MGRKPVNFTIIVADDNPEPYKILNEVRGKWHSDTIDAKVALAWRHNTKADADGRLQLGCCHRCSDLQKEFAEWDFIITLNKEVWDAVDFSKEKKIALVDHEMCHIGPVFDNKTGDHKQDERGRYLFRLRGHSIEEFVEIVDRHGCYKQDLVRFAEAMLAKPKEPMLDDSWPEGKKSGPKDLAAYHEKVMEEELEEVTF